MEMKIYFQDFDLEDEPSCIYDYLMFENEKMQTFGVYCGQKTGQQVRITGDYLIIVFSTDYSLQKRGFLIMLTAVPIALPKVTLPAPVVRALRDYRVTCSAAGTPPIHVAMIRNSVTLVNTTNSATIRLQDEGNYTCLATSKYGTDIGNFTVIFNDCGPHCISYGIQENRLNCLEATSAVDIFKCAPMITEQILLLLCNFSRPPVGIFSHLTNLNSLQLSLNAIEILPDGVLADLKSLRYLDLSSNVITSLPVKVFANLTNLQMLNFASNAITFLPDGLFASLTNLLDLDLSLNAITFLPVKVFSNLTKLQALVFSSNAISFLPEEVFANLTKLINLVFSSNAITYLPAKAFATLSNLEYLEFSSNAITSLPDGVFANLTKLQFLKLDSNSIETLAEDLFFNLHSLTDLNLSSNNIHHLPAKLFINTSQLTYLDLSYNKIQTLPKGLFCCTDRLEFLILQNNMITFISKETLPDSTHLGFIFLSANRLENIAHHTFFNVKPGQHLGYGSRFEEIIMLSDNPITTIAPGAFKVHSSDYSLFRIYLLRTKLKILSLNFFLGLQGLDTKTVIRNRMIGTLTFFSTEDIRRCLVYLNPLDSDTEAVMVIEPGTTMNRAFVSALLASGFRRIHDKHTDYYYHKFLPCPLGTFYNSTSKGQQGCVPCPPGGFYSDDVGYVAKSCKECPNGSFVHFDEAPGTRPQDCKSCPEGTETDFFAGYRACKCLKGFYRTHMFNKCHKCGQGGLECKDDYASLKNGYWWEWRNKTHIHRYRHFITNLLASVPESDAFHVHFPHPIPTPYKCPIEDSCEGGLESPCGTGYEGPLCAVCSSGYYKQLQTCKQCPSKKGMTGQLSIIAAILLLIMAVSLWIRRSKRNTTDNNRRHSLIEMFLSKLKIVIGFYQVTYGLLEAFSFIKWPDSLQFIGKYSELLQLNVLQIAPIQCFIPGLQVDAFGNLFAIMAINGAVICVSGVAYGACKVVISRVRSLDDEEKSQKVSQTKEHVYRNLLFFLYVTYLSTCFKTASVLPLACRRLCRDEKEELCQEYLKADYSIRCNVPHYNHMVIAAYISTAYVLALPSALFSALWRQRRLVLAETSEDPKSGVELITGLRFLFENYKTSSWYWELIEMSRKVILTSGLILVGQESRSYIGLAWVIAGMYGMLFAWVKPIEDATENRLMATSLAATVVNLGIGAVSRIPAENIPASRYPYVDAILFKILVFGANTLVIALLVVQYALHMYRYFKEWRKNPQWSLSCCLAVLLPLNDFQGSISGFAGTNVFKTQLQTGEFEIPTVVAVLKDSGSIDVTDDEGEQDGDTLEVQDDNLQPYTEHNDAKRHQGTQTEVSTFTSSKVNVVLHEPMAKIHFC
ncbi:uncharacterized protein LOC144654286 [Oculina patagonica]